MHEDRQPRVMRSTMQTMRAYIFICHRGYRRDKKSPLGQERGHKVPELAV